MQTDDPTDLTTEQARALAALRVPVQPSAALYGSLLKRLRLEGATLRRVRPTIVSFAVAAAIILAFVAGMKVNSLPENTQPRFVLLLLNSPAARWPVGTTGPQIVQQFVDWTKPLADSSRLVLSGQLSDSRYLVDNSGVRSGDLAGGINGLFVIRAVDAAAAIALARTLPHARQGGMVAVQPFAH